MVINLVGQALSLPRVASGPDNDATAGTINYFEGEGCVILLELKIMQQTCNGSKLLPN